MKDLKKTKTEESFIKQSKKSKLAEKNQGNSVCSDKIKTPAADRLLGDNEKIKTIETEAMERHEAEEGPFMIVGSPGSYNICLGNDVCHPKSFKTTEEANECIKNKDWDLILIAGIIYNEKVNIYKKTLSNGK